MDAIVVKNLTKSYGKTAAVDHLSFSVKKGNLFGLLGVNGAGKSTLINMLSTLIAPNEGSACLCGYSLEKENIVIRNKIGVVYQENCLDDLLTVEENLVTSGGLYGMTRQIAYRRAKEILSSIKMEDLSKKRYKILSGGQKRKCEIAAVLMHTPEILFLDEPTTGLDPASRKDIWKLIENLRERDNMTVFLTTHYMEEAAMADHICIIDKGHLIDSGSPVSLKEKYAKDKLKLYYKKDVENELLKKLGELPNFKNIKHDKQGYLEISLENTLMGISILEKVKSYLKSFEVIQGTMDDVFLFAIGAKGEKNNEE